MRNLLPMKLAARFQNKDRDFRRTVDPQRKPIGADSTIGVLKHTSNFVQSAGIFSPRFRQDRRPIKWQDNLPAMGMPRHLQIESSGLRADICKVRLVDQQDRRAMLVELSDDVVEAHISVPGVIQATKL